MSGRGIHNCLYVRQSSFGNEYKLWAPQVNRTASHYETISMNHNNLYQYLDKIFKHFNRYQGALLCPS